MAFPTLAAEVGFTTDPGAATTWTDISAKLRGFQTTRGRQQELQRFEAGTGRVLLRNHDRRFDPTYAGAIANLVTNPSFEVNTTGWTLGAAFSRSNGWAQVGSWSLKVTNPAGAQDSYTANINVTAGMSYAFSAYVNNGLNGSCRIAVDYWNGGWQVDWQQVIVAAGSSERASVVAAIPVGGTAVRFRAIVDGARVGAAYWDGFQVEQASAVDTYCDGAQDNCRWSGTAHASTSYRGGPYYPYVLPMRRVRLSAVYGGNTYYLFTGYVLAWPQLWPMKTGIGLVELDCVDAVEVLQRAQISDTAYAEELSSVRVANVLDDVSWPAGDRDIDTGASSVQAGTITETAWQHLQDVADSEAGAVFIDNEGQVAFRNRNWHGAADNVSLATFGDGGGAELPYADLVANYGAELLYNEIRITREGGTEQVQSDATSQTTYLTRTLPKSGLLLTSDTEALSYAALLLTTYKDPAIRFDEMVLFPQKDDSLWAQALGREIGDKITIRRRPPGGGDYIEQDCYIESIAHEVRPGYWKTTWRFSLQPPITYITFGTSTFGAGHVIGF